jgi:hypothetical protein
MSSRKRWTSRDGRVGELRFISPTRDGLLDFKRWTCFEREFGRERKKNQNSLETLSKQREAQEMTTE